MRRRFVVGNWKMNATLATASALAKSLASAVPAGDAVDVGVCPPFPYLATVAGLLQGSGIQLGGQNLYFQKPGAFTGEVAGEMLRDVGCQWVILGHSERRHQMGETDAVVCKKVKRAIEAGLSVILCVGETLDERKANRTNAVLDTQMAGSLEGVDAGTLAKVVIAYEPVWAIGTGVNAEPHEAEAAHLHLRTWLKTHYNPEVADSTRILYGGSVKGSNADKLLAQPNIDGVLVGGASLDAEDFKKIIQAGAGK
jgi:triosephosphate isomerase